MQTHNIYWPSGTAVSAEIGDENDPVNAINVLSSESALILILYEVLGISCVTLYILLVPTLAMDVPTQPESVTWQIEKIYLDITPFLSRQGISFHAMVIDVGENECIFGDGVVGGATMTKYEVFNFIHYI